MKFEKESNTENLLKEDKFNENCDVKDKIDNESIQTIEEENDKHENYHLTIKHIIKLIDKVKITTKFLLLYFFVLSIFFMNYIIKIKNDNLDQSINAKVIIDNWISKPIMNFTISEECQENLNVEDLANFNDLNIACDCSNSIFNEFKSIKPHSCGIILNLIGCKDVFVNTPVFLNKWKNKLICTERANFSYYDTLLYNSIKSKFEPEVLVYLDDLLISRKNKSEILPFIEYVTDTYINSDIFNKMEIDVYVKNEYVSKSVFTNYDNWDTDDISYFRRKDNNKKDFGFKNNHRINSTQNKNTFEGFEFECKINKVIHDTIGNKLCLDYFSKNNKTLINNKDLFSLKKNTPYSINDQTNKNETTKFNFTENQNQDKAEENVDKIEKQENLEFESEIIVEIPKKSTVIVLDKEKDKTIHLIKQFDIKENNLKNEEFSVNSLIISEYYPCLIESNKKRLRNQNNYLYSLNTLKEYLEKLYSKFNNIFNSVKSSDIASFATINKKERTSLIVKNQHLNQKQNQKLKKNIKESFSNFKFSKKSEKGKTYKLRSLDDSDCELFENSYYDKRYSVLDLYSFEDYIKNDITKYLLSNDFFKSSKNSFFETTISNDEVLYLTSQPFFGWNYKSCSSGIIKEDFKSNLNEFIFSLNKTESNSTSNFILKSKTHSHFRQEQLDFVISDKNEDFLKIISNINNIVDFHHDPYFIISDILKNHEKIGKLLIIIIMLRIVVSIYVYTLAFLDFFTHIYSANKNNTFKTKKRFSLTFASTKGMIEREYGFRELNSNLETNTNLNHNNECINHYSNNVNNKNSFNFLNYSNTKSSQLKMIHRISIYILMFLLFINSIFVILVIIFMLKISNIIDFILNNNCMDSNASKIFYFTSETIGNNLTIIVIILTSFIVEMLIFYVVLYYNECIRSKRHEVKLQKQMN